MAMKLRKPSSPALNKGRIKQLTGIPDSGRRFLTFGQEHIK